jgi:hypothetical protein
MQRIISRLECRKQAPRNNTLEISHSGSQYHKTRETEIEKETDRQTDRQQRQQQREQRSGQKRKKTEAVVFTRAEAVARRREPWREEKEDRNGTEAPWLWSEDAFYFTATKKKRKKKKKTTFGATTTTTTTILHEFACSHQRDIRLKATTLSSTKSRILASTTTTDTGTLQFRLPCPTR